MLHLNNLSSRTTAGYLSSTSRQHDSASCWVSGLHVRAAVPPSPKLSEGRKSPVGGVCAERALVGEKKQHVLSRSGQVTGDTQPSVADSARGKTFFPSNSASCRRKPGTLDNSPRDIFCRLSGGILFIFFSKYSNINRRILSRRYLLVFGASKALLELSSPSEFRCSLGLARH